MKKLNIILLNTLICLVSFAQAPNWSVTPSDFQYTSTLTGVVIINDTLINTQNNILGAFVNGQVRGVATPTNVGGTEMYFITLYSNTAIGENVTFQAYIGSEDSIHNVIDSVAFTSNAAYGDPVNPHELYLNLNQSAYFTQFNQYTSAVSNQFQSVNLQNYTVNSSNLPIEYTVQSSSGNLNVGIVNNTLIVNHNGGIGVDSILLSIVDSNNLSFVYDSAYMYFEVLADNDSIYFIGMNDFNLGSNSTPCINLNSYLINLDNDSINWQVTTFYSDSIGDTTVSWSVNPSSFQYSMNFTIEASIDGLDLQDLNYQLAVFDGTNIVGKATPNVVLGKTLFFVTAYSNSTSSTLDFELWDADDNILYHEQVASQSFVANGILGDVSEPLQTYFGTHSYDLNDGLLCISLFDSIPGLVDSFMVVATEVGTSELYSDTSYFNVFYFDDNQPYLNGIPNQIILTGSFFSSFYLNDYLTEIDGDSIVYSVAGADSVLVSILPNDSVVLSPNSTSWLGIDTMVFFATDFTSNALLDVDTVVFGIVPGIELLGIPDQTINSLQSFQAVPLNNYLDHYYSDPVVYSVNSSELITLINNDTLYTYLPFGSWLGTDTIIVSVQNINQPQLFDTDTLVYEVIQQQGVNLPIEYFGIDSLSLTPISNVCFDFGNNVINVDQDSLSWEVAQIDSSNFIAAIDNAGELCLSITNSLDFIDSVLIVVQESNTIEMYSDSVWVVISYSSIVPLQIDVFGVQDQTINEMESFATIDLISHLDYAYPDSVIWDVTFSESELIGVALNNELNIYFPSSNWVGVDTLYLRATDVNHNQVTDVDTAIFAVLNLSAINELKEYEIELFPNPNNGIFSIKSNKELSIDLVAIYNSSGVLLDSNVKREVTGDLTVAGLNPGVYFILLETGSSRMKYKIVVQ